MVLYYMNVVSVLLCLILQVTVARVVLPSDHPYIDDDYELEYHPYIDDDYELEYHPYIDDDYELECELTEMPPEPDSMCCGVDVSSSNRIVGGSPTSLKQYPWLALIEYEILPSKTSYYYYLYARCGGSLISGLYVLTAAHCVAGSILETSRPVNVVLGDYNRFQNGPDCVQEKSGEKVCSDGETRIAIERTIPHEHYNLKSKANDIALVKLAKIAPYTDFIRPICLPTFDYNNIRTHKKLWLSVAGWGTMKQVNTTEGTYSGILSDVKRHLQVPYVPLKKCSPWRVKKYQICAGGLPGQNACNGDSGGPLMYNNDGQYELVGVVSFGSSTPCGEANVPEVFTNVYNYYEWIMNVINKF